jgi:ankyrin repeat protein
MLWLNCAYANVNATDNDGCTVLHRLCANNQLRGIRRLFASGWRDRIDPNIVDQSGHTPLLHAVAARHPAVVRALAAASIGVDFALDVNNDGTPLFHAALHAELVQELLTAGAPAQDTDALTYMCLLNQTTSVVRMLACGARAHAGAASVHHARLQRMTPLLAACRTQAYGLAKILLRDKRGRAGPFGVNYAPSCGNTALHVAAATSTKCARMLLKLPSVAVNARDCCGMTPLYKACVCDKRDTAMQLLARPDVDMDVVHNTYTGHYGNDFPHYAWTVMCEPGDTPLLAAIRNEMWDVVNCMYARGVDAALGDHRLVRDVLHGRRRRRKAFDRQRILRPLTVLLCAGRRRLRLPAELWMHVLLFARPQTWRYT